jgi:alcohol dehydrogenase class IV
VVSFDFATAGRVMFGLGRVAEVGAAARAYGRQALVIGGRSPLRADWVARLLEEAGVASVRLVIAQEPSIEHAVAGAALARSSKCDVVVAVGGGSVIDSAKAIAALATNDGDVFDYLEVIGKGQPLVRASLPVIAVPTTAGTGSEATRNAVLSSSAHRVKVSLRSPTMLPCVAIVDPELTVDLPPAMTAATGLDALTQLIEPYVSTRSNPMADALCVAGIARAAVALPRAFRDGTDLGARSDMALASLWGGIALANAGLGAVHGLAGPIGGMFKAPHGAVCAALLPHVMAVNLDALARVGDARALARYDEVAPLVTGRPSATGPDGVTWVEQLVRALAVPRLAAWGLGPGDVDALIEPARRASSMKANPIALSPEQLREILVRAL